MFFLMMICCFANSAEAQPIVVRAGYLDAYAVSGSKFDSRLVLKPDGISKRNGHVSLSSFPIGIFPSSNPGTYLFKINEMTPIAKFRQLVETNQYNHIVASFSSIEDADLLFACELQKNVDILEVSNTRIGDSLVVACKTWDLLGLDASGLELSEAAANAVCECKSLQILSLSGTKNKEGWLAKNVVQFKDLRFAFLNQGDRGKETWKAITTLKWLNTIDASDSDFSDNDLTPILNMPMLRNLYLHNSKLTTKGIEQLLVPNTLESFSISDLPGLDVEIRKKLIEDNRAILVNSDGVALRRNYK
jgi:Leucine-rich repeat (LRR) protein